MSDINQCSIRKHLTDGQRHTDEKKKDRKKETQLRPTIGNNRVEMELKQRKSGCRREAN